MIMSWLTTYPSKKSITNLLASRISFLLSLPLILGTIGCGGDDPVTTDESAEKTPASEVDSTDITDGNLDEGLAPDPVDNRGSIIHQCGRHSDGIAHHCLGRLRWYTQQHSR